MLIAVINERFSRDNVLDLPPGIPQQQGHLSLASSLMVEF